MYSNHSIKYQFKCIILFTSSILSCFMCLLFSWLHFSHEVLNLHIVVLPLQDVFKNVNRVELFIRVIVNHTLSVKERCILCRDAPNTSSCI